MRTRGPLALLALAALAACQDTTAPVVPGAPDGAEGPTAGLTPESPIGLPAIGPGRPIPGQYIVVLRDDVPSAASSAREMAGSADGEVLYTYGSALKGFTIRLRNPRAAAALANNPNVLFIEQDQEFTTQVTQSGATWGLDRIDQRARPLSGTFTYTRTGAGVNAYILDTGIRYTHVDFGGRAVPGFDAIGDGRNGDDCDGHGTHVAGTVGGATWGVAKAVRLVAVRVLNCQGSGTTSGVIAGVDWVRANHVKPAVANMSLGGGASTALDNAVTSAINAGVTFVVAAGNSNRDACQFSPARTGAAVTVGSTTSTDARSSFSNFGSCLDLFAPGSSITSAWFTSNTATVTISGTSMAAPHVAGVAALYLQGTPSASPATVRNALVANATTNVVTSAGRNSPNRLLFTNY
jgi:subtilisin family serine protease